MARLESVSVAGFYPTPPHIVEMLTRVLLVTPGKHTAYLDPCAGEGAAIRYVAETLSEGLNNDPHVYTVEMEKGRYAALKASRVTRDHALHGDAFCVQYSGTGVGLLYLNPPYDLDAKHGRLEQRFLDRYTSSLVADGTLCFIVPYYALSASAETLATHYRDVECFRFPDDDFQIYKQVVLFATKRSSALFAPYKNTYDDVMRWSKDPASMPVLTGHDEKRRVVASSPYYRAFDTWVMGSVDMTSLVSQIRPWYMSERRSGKLVKIPFVCPEGSIADFLDRKYNLAMPPRPAHIASGLAAGVFNGSRILPDDEASGLPPLLVKGVFDREFKTVEEKENTDGSKVGEVQVQHPKLVTTVLNLATGAYVTLRPSAERTDMSDLSAMTLADLLHHYGRGLMSALRKQCVVLHDPANDADHIELPELARNLYSAQAHAAMAAIKLLGGPGVSLKARKGKSAFVLGEIGSGKCLKIGTPVMRYDGMVVPVEDVRTGDLLMGPDSKPRRVLGTTRGVGPLYKITPVKGDTWVCNDAHILTLVHTMSGDVFDVPVQEYTSTKRLKRKLSLGGRTTHTISEFKQFFPENGVDFPKRDDPIIDPYFLGLWYGDGGKGKTPRGVNLTGVVIHKPDPEVRACVEDMADHYGLVYVNRNKNGRCPVHAVSSDDNSNQLLEDIRKVYGDGSSLPEACLFGSREVRKQFLAGFLDADGHLSNGSYDFIQKRESWSRGVCFIARSLGIQAVVSKARKSAVRGQEGNWYWRVSLSGDFTGLPLRIARRQAESRAKTRVGKKAQPQSATRNMAKVNRTGIKVEPIGDGEYAGFELSGDGRFLLGDFTVTHNTSTSIAVIEAIQSKKTLVLCPPHLLSTWVDEVNKTVPHARTMVIESATDLDALKNDHDTAPVFAILSREKAKLGHAYEGVSGGACPKCGAEISTERDHAKTRAHCENRTMSFRGKHGRALGRVVDALASVFPNDLYVRNCVQGKYQDKYLKTIGESGTTDAFAQRAWKLLKDAGTIQALVMDLVALGSEEANEAVQLFLTADPDPDLILRVVQAMLAKPFEVSIYDQRLQSALRLLLLTPNNKLSDYVGELSKRFPASGDKYNDPWRDYAQAKDRLYGGKTNGGYSYSYSTLSSKFSTNRQEQATFNEKEIGSLQVATGAIVALKSYRSFSKVCGEPLYQAIPQPRRFPIATAILRRYPKLFDALVIDECHEYAGGSGSNSSAQERAAHRLTGLKLPTLQLTGSFMNGYAESMFSNMWASDPEFRKEFGYSERNAFVDRYGYRKRYIEDKEDGKVVSFGSMSDRVERSSRQMGKAPGVLPLFVFQHLLRQSVTIHKADLSTDIPPCTETVVEIDPSDKQISEYNFMLKTLLERIKADKHEEGLSGKLWGALAHFPSYLDLASSDTGNNNDGTYVIQYPESCGGAVVCRSSPMPADEILPKEAWMLDQVERSIAEGRNVMVFAWHTALLPRLARLLEKHLGTACPILDPSKVPTAKRQAWIDREIVKKKRRVLVVNPVTIQTGLNNLVYFSDEIWMENVGCNPIIYRQAIGRIDRIGQNLATRVFFPVYRNSLQEALRSLLLHKTAVSLSTDGLDAESTMAAAGIGEDGEFGSLDVGKHLYKLLTEAGSVFQKSLRAQPVARPRVVVKGRPPWSKQKALTPAL